MEEFKHWVKTHKALAIGGGIALVVLLYLWLRSGSSAGANTGNAGLQSYYAAEAASTQGAAAQVVAQDQLQAAENQTNTAGAVAQAQIAAQKSPYQAQLDELTALANLQAYQDYLGAANGTNTTSTPAPNPAQLVKVADNYGGTNTEFAYGPPGTSGTLFSLPWGSHGGAGIPQIQSAAASGLSALEGLPGYTAIGTGTVPGTAPPPIITTSASTPVIQPGQFNGFGTPAL